MTVVIESRTIGAAATIWLGSTSVNGEVTHVSDMGVTVRMGSSGAEIPFNNADVTEF